jgi:hypothetical protein
VRALKSAQKEVSPKALRYLLAQTGPPPPTLVNPASRVVNVSNWHEADIKLRPLFGRFSNRPFGVKRLQTIHRCSVDVAHGLVLLFGIGTKALVWDFFSQEVQAWWRIFFSSSFFADLKVRFFFLSRLRSRDACQATLWRP